MQGRFSTRFGLVVTAFAIAACAGPANTPPSPTKSGGKLPPHQTTLKNGASLDPATVATSAPGETPHLPLSGLPVVSLTPPPGLLPGLLSNNGGSLLSDNGSSIIANTTGAMNTGTASTGSVTGLVTVPGYLLSNNGGNVVSNGGAKIVSNNGSGYHLAQQAPETASVPYVGTTVYLADATGRLIKDPAGKPAAAKTDAQGRYSFQGSLPVASNYLVVTSLPGDRGQLVAIAPKGSDRNADVNLASSLTIGYIVSQYVRDPSNMNRQQSALDKLPPDLETRTRQAAKAAIVANPPSITTLDRTTVVATINTLRKQANDLDTKLEDVKKLLVAGQSDLGVGKSATEAALPWIRTILPAPDGGYYLSAALSGRVFKVGTDRLLRTAVGSGAGYDAGSLNGKKAVDAGLMTIQGLALDDASRLLVLESRRLCRLEADGTLKQLWPQSSVNLIGVAADGTGGLWLLTRDKLIRLLEDGTQQETKTFTAGETSYLQRVTSFGFKGTTFSLLSTPGGSTPYGEIRRLNVATGVFEAGVKATGDARGFAVAPSGLLYQQGTNGAIIRFGGEAAEAEAAPGSAGVNLNYACVAEGPSNSFYWGFFGAIHRVTGAEKALVAGKKGISPGPDGQVALNRPGGLLVEPDGALVLAVAGDNQVARLKGSDIRVLAGNGDTVTAVEQTKGDGGAAIAAPLPNPTALRRDAAGNLYILQAGRSVRRVAKDTGAISTVFALPPETTKRLYAFEVTGDGGRLFLTGGVLGAGTTPVSGWVSQWAIATQTETPIIEPADSNGHTRVIALDAQDRLYVLGEGEVRRFTDPLTSTVVASHAAIAIPNGWTALVRATFGPGNPNDPTSLFFVAGSAATTINRLDLGTGALKAVAGPDTNLLAGEGVDDSIANAMGLAFDGSGNLFFCDSGHNQIKRLPAAALSP